MNNQNCQFNIILLSYQEAANLKILLPQVRAVIATWPISAEIIVIDTLESMDDTAEVCVKNETKYINRSPTNSYADAFRTALKCASGDYFIFMDADGSHPPEFLQQMFATWQHTKDVDLIIGSRYIRGGKTDNSILLVGMSKLLNMIYSKVLNLKVKDVSNSLRLYKASCLSGLKLHCQHFDVLEEVLFCMYKNNADLKVVEIPFTFKKRLQGNSKRVFAVFVFNYLKTLYKLWLLKRSVYREKTCNNKN